MNLDFTKSSWFRRFVGILAGEYLRLVWWTNRFSYDPPDLYARFDPIMPSIVVFWHGTHFMTPFIKLRRHRVSVLVSLHRDGEIIAAAVKQLGLGVLRGSGDNGREFGRKGAVRAFLHMLRALKEGDNIGLTADIPKVSRVASLGAIMLSRSSGRPIVPFAIATSRFIRLNNWDRAVIHLPFGRGVMVMGEAMTVPPDADEATMETTRLELETALDEVTSRAYAAVGRPDVSLLKAAQHV